MGFGYAYNDLDFDPLDNPEGKLGNLIFSKGSRWVCDAVLDEGYFWENGKIIL